MVGPPVVIRSITSQRQTEPNARGLANAFVPTASYDGTSVGCFAHLASNLRSFSIGIWPIPVPPYGTFFFLYATTMPNWADEGSGTQGTMDNDSSDST